MKLKTTELQDAVTKVYKGVGNNRLIPLTSLINILVSEETLLLTSTDSVNYFTVKIDNVTSEDFEVSVNADVFAKLVQKMTSDTISIEVLDNYLMVVGNGKYKIDLLLDEDGQPVKFPTKDSGEPKSKGQFSVGVVRKALNHNKASLATSNEVPCLANYYCGDSIISTDRYKICQTGIKLFDTPHLISPSTMDLLSLFSTEHIQYYEGEDSFSFDSENEFLYAPFVSGIEKMPIDAIQSLLKQDFESVCKLSKDALTSVLDRLALFVSPYDKNGIYLTFSKDGLSIASKKSNGSELVEFESTENFKDYTCCIDIEMLRSQVNTISTNSVELHFGADVAIKFVDGNVTKIVALMEDDRIG